MYEQTIEINPDYAVAWHNLGLIDLRQDKLGAALANVEKSCELVEYSDSLFLNSLAQILIKRGEWERASEICDRALTLPIDRPEVEKSLLHKRKLLDQRRRTSSE